MTEETQKSEEIIKIGKLPILKENPSQKVREIANKKRFEILENIIKRAGFRKWIVLKLKLLINGCINPNDFGKWEGGIKRIV